MNHDITAPPSRPPASAQSRDLNDAEFEELDGLLALIEEPLEPLDVVMLDGYLCGVLVQPVLIEPTAWLARVFDFDGRALPDLPAPAQPIDPAAPPVASGRAGHPWFERTRALIERRHAALNRALVEDGWFDPMVLELDEASLASESAAAKRAEIGIDLVSEPLLPWVAGFQHATVCFPDLAELPDDDVQTALARLFRHLPADTDDERSLVEMLKSQRPLATLDDGIDELVASVADLYDLTSARRYRVETVKRELPKVGRNDPCPCGSGRKFKVCHGASGPAA